MGWFTKAELAFFRRIRSRFANAFDFLVFVCDVYNICDSRRQLYLLEYVYYRELNPRRKRRRYRNYTNAERKRVVELFRAGYPIYRIAKIMDMPVSSVYYIVKGMKGMGVREERSFDPKFEDYYRRRKQSDILPA